MRGGEGDRSGGDEAERGRGGENERRGRKDGILGDAGSGNPGRRPRVPASTLNFSVRNLVKRARIYYQHFCAQV